MEKICQKCAFRTSRKVNAWNEQPAYICKNKDSFRHARQVLRGMNCDKFEASEKAA